MYLQWFLTVKNVTGRRDFHAKFIKFAHMCLLKYESYGNISFYASLLITLHLFSTIFTVKRLITKQMY